jgi:UDPglucose--hexose-1-phosphate uridylyltransferase
LKAIPTCFLQDRLFIFKFLKVKKENKFMPEFRQNRVTKNWVIVATERAKRPHDFLIHEELATLPEFDPKCPFCPGNEEMTPPEIYRIACDDKWSVRVVPNKFSAVVPDVELRREVKFQFFRRVAGYGFHYVIIETPIHNLTIATMSEEQVCEIFKTYLKLYRDLMSNPNINVAIIFRNNGKRAGTSLEHPHSQLIASPIVPTHIRHLLEEATRYYDDHGSCVFCDMISIEEYAGERVVYKDDDFLVIEPFASISPFETWILPRKHNACFGNISEQEACRTAKVVRLVLKQLYDKLNNPDYNYVIHSSPFKDANEEFYHWYIQILPRLTIPAGFELGSGIYITTALPEETAKFLKINQGEN